MKHTWTPNCPTYFLPVPYSVLSLLSLANVAGKDARCTVALKLSYWYTDAYVEFVDNENEWGGLSHGRARDSMRSRRARSLRGRRGNRQPATHSPKKNHSIMNILVTGGAGFIGSHLVGKLLVEGHQVAIIDNLSTGSLENLQSIRDHADLTFVHGDIREGDLVQMFVKECDCIFHLAAAVGVRLIAEDPVHTIETNIGGTEIVLKKANRFGKKIFLASTSEVYGKSEAVPFREEDDFVLGSTAFSRWSYACSKAIDEFLGQAYFEQYGLNVVIGRLFNTIGPRQTGRYGMVVPRFVQWALRDEPIQIYGTGQQTRCFCYVGDVVEGVMALMLTKKAAGKVFNIGSTDEISIEQLADRVIEVTGSQGGKTHVSYQDAYGRSIEDMMRRVPCTDRISETIGWEPKTPLEEILKMVVEYEKGR